MWGLGHGLNMSPAPVILTHFLILSCKCLLTDYPLGGQWGWWNHPNVPGTEMSVIIPSSSSSSRSDLWGGFWSVLSLDIWLSWSSCHSIPGLRALLHRWLLRKHGGSRTGRCTSLHILFSFLLYHNIWVMLGEDIIDHRDIAGASSFHCWRGHIRLRAALSPGPASLDWTFLLSLFLPNLVFPQHWGRMITLHGVPEGSLLGFCLWCVGLF